MKITEKHLTALEYFASDCTICDVLTANKSEINFASAKHFEEFTEEEQNTLVNIIHSIFEGLSTNMQIIGMTEEELSDLITSKI